MDVEKLRKENFLLRKTLMEVNEKCQAILKKHDEREKERSPDRAPFVPDQKPKGGD